MRPPLTAPFRSNRSGRRRCLAAVLVGLLAAPALIDAGEGPIVAAAADLKFALEDVAARFAVRHGRQVVLVFGSSGHLTRQLLDGAPFEMFLAADEGFVFQLADAGLTRDRGRLYAEGRLVIFAPTGSPLRVDSGLAGLRALVDQGRVSRFAIANPAHAPYGRAAEAVLRRHGLWEPLQGALVLGENVGQAAQFAASGNAVGGLIAYALVHAPALRQSGTYALVPERDHPPLRQRMVLMKRAGTTAERFYEFLQAEETRGILDRYGFAVPPR